MQAIRKLDQYDTDVVGHGQQHFADALGLPGFGAAQAQFAQLGDAGDDVKNIGTENFLDFFRCRRCIFENIVQKTGGDADFIEGHVREDAGDLQRMGQVGFT